MDPIKVKYNNGSQEWWGLWIDTVSGQDVLAVIIPLGDEDPIPITIKLGQITVLKSQSSLELDVPKI